LDAGAHVLLRARPTIRLGGAQAQSLWNDGDGRARELGTRQRLPDGARRKANGIEHRDLDPVESTILDRRQSVEIRRAERGAPQVRVDAKLHGDADHTRHTGQARRARHPRHPRHTRQAR
jgi:hypothetical protein